MKISQSDRETCSSLYAFPLTTQIQAGVGSGQPVFRESGMNNVNHQTAVINWQEQSITGKLLDIS